MGDGVSGVVTLGQGVTALGGGASVGEETEAEKRGICEELTVNSAGGQAPGGEEVIGRGGVGGKEEASDVKEAWRNWTGRQRRVRKARQRHGGWDTEKVDILYNPCISMGMGNRMIWIGNKS